MCFALGHGQLVAAFVLRVACVALDPDVGDLVPGFLLQCLCPEVRVQGGGAICFFPAPALPVFGPALLKPVDDILAVGAQPYLARLLELAQCFDKGCQLHAVVGGAVVAAAQLFFVNFAVKMVAQHGTPAARAGIAAACAVGVHFDLLHAVLLLK